MMIKPVTLGLSLTIVGCGVMKPKKHQEDQAVPIVTSYVVTELPPVTEADRRAGERIETANVTAPSERVSGQITLKKSEIFGRTFLYGFDLQYSSAGNAQYSLLDQSMALGHIPATFRQLGHSLQLVADNRRLFESVVNHPETLINEYEIVAETENELTITMPTPGLLVHKTLNGADKPDPSQQWLRSIEFDANGSYLLQESAIMLQSGEVQTILESLFPRDSLVPANYVGIEDNRDTNEKASRFMLISNEKVFVQREVTHGVPVREQTAFANRFHLKNEDSTIDWYVTANAPEELMGELRSGTIGWNRYFKDQLGRDVVRFMGRLPANVKLGDPRYNVINFDTVAQAGAAYESQASDPLTGIQSHSLIYMPYAWYNIAAGLSSAREIPASRVIGPKSPEVMFGAKRDIVRCVREASEVADLSVASSEDVVDNFGRRVFISTLFHEMGHAFGLGHNFKGSLAFDGTKPVDEKNQTSYSVMDYNYYQHEIDLFREIGGDEGPRLEYDRQAISYLYQNGKDIAASDKVIPACNDDDADGKAGGVDPNCLRYDAELNPIVGLQHAYDRLVNESGAAGIEPQTLSELILVHKDLLLTKLRDETLARDAAAAEELVSKKVTGLGKLIGYFISGGAQSLRVNLTLNANALRAWRHDPAEDGVTMPEAERRIAYVQILQKAVDLQDLPAAPRAALDKLVTETSAVILETARFGSASERSQLAEKIAKKINDSTKKSAKSALGRMRGGVASAIGFDKELSFASFLFDGLTAEEIAVKQLTKIVLADLTKDSRSEDDNVKGQRSKAAASLKTFAGLSDEYKAQIDEVKSQLLVIARDARATNQEVVDQIRGLLQTL